MLIHNHAEDLSVTAKYDPPKDFISLSRNEVSASNDFYYGVSPCLDKRELMHCISNLELQSIDRFNNYVKKHGDWFMMHSEHKEYLFPLAKYIVICMASHFGIRIKMDYKTYGDLLCFLTECGYSDSNIKTMLSYTGNGTNSIQPEDPVLTIKGCPTDVIIRFLNRYKYHYLCKEKAIPLIDIKTGKNRKKQLKRGK